MNFKQFRERYVSLFPLKYREPRIYATNEFIKKISKEIPKGSKVIDLGAGECQYEHHFSHCDYTSQDNRTYDGFDYSKIDIISDITNIPVEDGSFEFAINTEVIEHIYDTKGMFREIARILKPGGKAYMTVAANSPEHQIPNDFFRFTRYSIAKLAEESGFEIVYLKPAGGYFNFSSLVLMGFGMIPSTRVLWYVFLPFLCLGSYILNKLDFLDTEKRFTHHYLVVMKRT